MYAPVKVFCMSLVKLFLSVGFDGQSGMSGVSAVDRFIVWSTFCKCKPR